MPIYLFIFVEHAEQDFVLRYDVQVQDLYARRIQHLSANRCRQRPVSPIEKQKMSRSLRLRGRNERIAFSHPANKIGNGQTPSRMKKPKLPRNLDKVDPWQTGQLHPTLPFHNHITRAYNRNIETRNPKFWHPRRRRLRQRQITWTQSHPADVHHVPTFTAVVGGC